MTRVLERHEVRTIRLYTHPHLMFSDWAVAWAYLAEHPELLLIGFKHKGRMVEILGRGTPGLEQGSYERWCEIQEP